MGPEESSQFHFYNCTFYFEAINLTVFVGMGLTTVYYTRNLLHFAFLVF